MNTPLSNAHYVQKQGMICPFCGGHNLDVSSPVIQNGDSAVQGVCCNECGRRWDDVFVLSGYQERPKDTGHCSETSAPPITQQDRSTSRLCPIPS